MTKYEIHAIINTESKKREVIKMTREQMMDEVIRQYGLESIITITFCVAAEDATISDTILREFYDELMK